MQRAAIGDLRQQGRRLIQNAGPVMEPPPLDRRPGSVVPFPRDTRSRQSEPRSGIARPAPARSRRQSARRCKAPWIAFPVSLMNIAPRDTAGPAAGAPGRSRSWPVARAEGGNRESRDDYLAIFAIRVVNRVDHSPEHFQLEGQRLEGLALSLHGRATPLHDREAMLHVAWRLNQPALEIIERFRRYPWVMDRERDSMR